MRMMAMRPRGDVGSRTGEMVTRHPTTTAIRSLAIACVLIVLVWASAARADERIYWANTGNNTIAYATVDGNRWRPI